MPRSGTTDADIADVLLDTGCRIGEVLASRCDQDGNGKGHQPGAPAEVGPFKAHHRPAAACCRCSDEAPYLATTESLHRGVFATRHGTWHQVGNIERRWRTIRADTGFDWATPRTFRKTVATLIDRLVDSDTAVIDAQSGWSPLMAFASRSATRACGARSTWHPTAVRLEPMAATRSTFGAFRSFALPLGATRGSTSRSSCAQKLGSRPRSNSGSTGSRDRRIAPDDVRGEG